MNHCEAYVVCVECNDTVQKKSAYHVAGAWYCEFHFHLSFFECAACGERGGWGDALLRRDGTFICTQCAENHGQCDICRHWVPMVDVVYHQGVPICTDCEKEEKRKIRSSSASQEEVEEMKRILLTSTPKRKLRMW